MPTKLYRIYANETATRDTVIATSPEDALEGFRIRNRTTFPPGTVFTARLNDLPLGSAGDTWITVYLRRYHSHNSPESGERIEVVARIPEHVAKSLAGPGREPTTLIDAIWQRAAHVATETVGEPLPPFAISVISEVDSVMPPELPAKSDWQDAEGAEGWVLTTGTGLV